MRMAFALLLGVLCAGMRAGGADMSDKEFARQAESIRCRVDSFYSTVNVEETGFFRAAPQEAAAAGHPAFALEDLSHPRLAELRENYRLEEVIAAGETEIERLALLCSWVKSRWEHQTPRIYPKWDALEMLQLAERGEKFFCVQSAILLMQCCQALGRQARKLEIHDASGNDHSVIEVYLKEHSKWAVLDPDYNLHYTRGGVPLSALELHDAWTAGEIADIEMVRGPCPYHFGETKGADMYTHLYYVWRNDFFSRPEAPVRLVHFTDAHAPAQLVADGRLLFADPRLFGPHYPYRDGKPEYMRPFSTETSAPVDGDPDTAWMADDNGEAHFIEFLFEEPRAISQVAVTWPKVADQRRAPREFTISTREGGIWQALIKSDLTDEEAQYPLTLPLPPGRFEGLRVEAPADPQEVNGGPSFGIAEIVFDFQ